MIREVYPGIFLSEIPLPKNPLKILNSYIIISEERPLILDTGFNREVCKDALDQGIRTLGIDLKKTDLVLTHMHIDHSGLADYLWKQGCKVYIGKKDGILLNNFRSSPEFVLEEISKGLNLDKELGAKEIKDFDIAPKEIFEYTPLKEGDYLEVGPYNLEVIDIPGHSPGHIGLYERKHKLFFGGDHILNEITPNITFWHYKIDSLGNFIKSLQKIRQFDIDLVLPAHRSLIQDHRQRIDQLLEHHSQRIEEITGILLDGKKTVMETAARMHWDLNYKRWEDFPLTQKWFASGEAMAHLEHLVHKGEAQRVNSNGGYYYELVN